MIRAARTARASSRSVQPQKAHPFELQGLGVGPFKFKGMVSIPSASMAEQNPEGYRQAMLNVPRGIGVGVCANCGQPLVHNCIVESADHKTFVVGSECVEKTGDKSLGDKVQVAVAQQQRDQRRAKAETDRAAAQEKFLSTVGPSGETNRDRITRENKERADKQESDKAARVAQASRWNFLLPTLDNQSGGFAQSIASGIRAGDEPRGRAVDILREIHSKAHGRRGSKDYEAAGADFDKRLGLA